MMPDLCIYHANCIDGFTAAWAIWRRWPDIAFMPASYGDAPPDVQGRHVLIVDFSYKRPVLEEMAETAASITVLDHHKTAEADLALFVVKTLVTPQRLAEGSRSIPPIQALFDMQRSGAMLAWDHAFAGPCAPLLVQYVQDRDLWRFALADTRLIHAALSSYPFEFEDWDDLAVRLETPQGRAALIGEGAAVDRKHLKDVGQLLDLSARAMVIGGLRVPVANPPYTMASDGANRLAEGNAFAATYYDDADGARVFSLRSQAGGADVSAIAARYGGGGHARAAGFKASVGWEGDAPDHLKEIP